MVAISQERLRERAGPCARAGLRLQLFEERQEEPKRRERKASSGNGRTARQGPSKNAIRRVADLERDIERAEAKLAALEDELADPAMWSSPTRRERATKRHADAKRAVEEAYAAWDAATG